MLLINNGRGLGAVLLQPIAVQPALGLPHLGLRPCPSSDIGFANFFLLPSRITARSVLLDSGIGSSSLSSPAWCCFNNQKDGKTKPFIGYC